MNFPRLRLKQLQNHPTESIHEARIQLPFGEALCGFIGCKICFLAPFQSPQELSSCQKDLRTRYPHALIEACNASKSDIWKGEVDALVKASDFEYAIWKTLAKTQRGETLSYGELARRAGKPKAARAVGTAMARNPIAVLIPCHRVLPADGRLGNYHWGVPMKQKLLDWEASAS